MKYPLHVTSEIGELKTVILHRPGKEVENLTPEYLQRLLFDDIPFLPAIQKEHDYFANALRNQGVEVLYLERLLEESLHSIQLQEQFVDQILEESKSNINGARHNVKEYLLHGSVQDLVEKVMSGVLKTDIEQEKKVHLYELMADHYPFYLDPMPNLYFTRDPAAVIGKGISINKMNESARERESIFMDYIMKYHPRFAKHNIPKWFTRDSRFSMEGGDQLILNKHTVAVGVSSRSTPQAIEKMAINLFKDQEDITKVVAVEIPKSRAFMHLDTVFTMVDYDKFTIHPAIEGPDGDMRIFILEKGEEENRVTIKQRNNLAETLKEVLELKDIVLIPCGGGDPIAAAREQWNDGSNTLAIAPGVVMTYDRNYVSNKLLRQHGLEVIEIPSSELSRGRGGPRCMSMPVYREDI
ncbi:arginine deiminase [Pontibacillus yanchengensis]|uniref:Arginine deiminase n=2 Tax=Pontibacillus yanchengensis TaxID=462910 RepID=A0A6I5A1I0_9BACI|nr:arginine deiminase [Pontibacillus yanchengensis]MYL34480.1 arginine deiminase [Pontibacillus yanchengensis]MYL54287.1 arginine deiminase [Pontibacillus yanchengensis]